MGDAIFLVQDGSLVELESKPYESGGLAPRLAAGQRLFSVYASSTIEIPFQYLREREPFANSGLRQELLARLNTIEGIDLPAEAIELRPNLRLATLLPGERLLHLLEVLAGRESGSRPEHARSELPLGCPSFHPFVDSWSSRTESMSRSAT